MVQQTKHTRKGLKAGRGKDIGKFKINSTVIYEHKLYKVKRKIFQRLSETIVYELKNNKETIYVPEIKLKKYTKHAIH